MRYAIQRTGGLDKSRKDSSDAYKLIVTSESEAWFNALVKKYEPVVTEDPAKREIRLLQQQLLEQKRIYDSQISELRAQVASLQQSTQRASVETGFGSLSALFVKRDAQTQTTEAIAVQSVNQ